MKLLIVQFSPYSYQSLLLGSKYIPRHFTLKYIQITAYTYGEIRYCLSKVSLLDISHVLRMY
jgi:hypothetical protein